MRRCSNSHFLVGHFHTVLETMTCGGALADVLIRSVKEAEPDVHVKAASFQMRHAITRFDFPIVSNNPEQLHRFCLSAPYFRSLMFVFDDKKR